MALRGPTPTRRLRPIAALALAAALELELDWIKQPADHPTKGCRRSPFIAGSRINAREPVDALEMEQLPRHERGQN